MEVGGWHTHEAVWRAGVAVWKRRESFLDVIEGTLAGRFAARADIGGSADGSTTILDRSQEDALIADLTSECFPGRVCLRSWSGALDPEVSLRDLA